MPPKTLTGDSANRAGPGGAVDWRLRIAIHLTRERERKAEEHTLASVYTQPPHTPVAIAIATP